MNNHLIIKLYSLVFIFFFLLSGCASQPEKIATSYVSPLEFKDYDCDQLAGELRRKNRRLNTLYSSIKKTADADQWQMGVGLILFWPTLFALEGGDSSEATEYARVKGEVEALQEAATIKKCGLENYSQPQ